MALPRLRRNEQLPGDLLVGVAAGDQPEHFSLPRSELVKLGVEARRWLGALRSAWQGGERVEHEPCQPRREHRVAGGHPRDRGYEFGTTDRLRDITPGTGPDYC